jgi:alginate O-acetyltransferase complex protein AlgI
VAGGPNTLMIFNTFAYYFLFLIPAAVLFRVCSERSRPWILVTFGCLFFVYFSYFYLGGAYAAACVGLFAWEATLQQSYRPRSKVCLFGIAASLGILGVFKYWNFATDLLTVGVDKNALRWEGAFLPLGVSFFTFEFIHYAADRYRNKAEKGTFAEYLAFIFFFPTMVAGPIKRFQDFVPCLRNPSVDWQLDFNRGITRILTGLVKKFAIADLLTSLTDHLNYADIALAERWVLPVWLFAYGWKIYFDFSAYSDIAIGSGRLFGISIPENFDWPYFRTNITEFWRHWHISLYKWLVDYVFIPLGGSRVSGGKVYRNILLVMLVSGVWHGAGVNYVVWGLWHGVMLCIHRWMTAASEHSSFPKLTSLFWGFCGWLATYVGVNLGWAFFAMDMETATLFFKRLVLG